MAWRLEHSTRVASMAWGVENNQYSTVMSTQATPSAFATNPMGMAQILLFIGLTEGYTFPEGAWSGAVWKSTGVSGAQSFLGDGASVLARSSSEKPASPRHRAGNASMAWRTTR